MDDVKRFSIEIPSTGRVIEVWQKGQGPDVVFLHGAGGFPGFTPDLDLLAKTCRVTVPLFPGFGVSTGIDDIDTVLDAVMHNFDVLKALRLSRPHLVGHSMGGMLAAEMAATCPNDVGKVVLVAPLGLWDDAHPVLDFFTVMPQEIAKKVFFNQKHPMAIAMSTMPDPDDERIVELLVAYLKGLSAAGRLLWPIPDRGLAKRLYRIAAPTLIVWGERDGLAPVFYAKEFQKRIAGSKLKTFKETSHMAMLEQPKAVVSAILQFFGESGAKGGKPEVIPKITLLSTAPAAPVDQRAKIAAAAQRNSQKHMPAPEPAAEKANAPVKPKPASKAKSPSKSKPAASPKTGASKARSVQGKVAKKPAPKRGSAKQSATKQPKAKPAKAKPKGKGTGKRR